MAFIAFATDPERNAGFVERAAIPAANLEAKPTYSAMQTQVDPTLNKKDGATVFLADAKWWSEESGQDLREDHAVEVAMRQNL